MTTTQEENSQEAERSSNSPLSAITFVAGTDIGMRREENQDSFGQILAGNFHYYIVADGMGGVRGGATASKLAIEIFESAVTGADGVDSEVVEEAIWQANRAIFSKGKNDPTLTGMGTTFVGIGFEGEKAYTINVGDSRAYRIRKGRILQLTEDHTLVQELVNSGALDAQHAENHPVSHMLTRSLGPAEAVRPDFRLVDNGPVRGDKYLLCSDGLYNLVTDNEILKIVSDLSPQEALDECIRLANERGGTDNITVTIVEVGEGYPKGEEDYPEIDDTQTIELDSSLYANGLSQKEQEGETPIISSSINLEHVVDNVPHEDEEKEEEARLQQRQNQSQVETEALRAPEPSNYKRFMLTAIPTSVVILFLVVWFTPGGERAPETETAKIVSQPEIAEKTSPQDVQPPRQEPVEVKKEVVKSYESTDSDNQELSFEPPPIDQAAKTLTQRSVYLERRIEQLRLQILSLSGPVSGDLGESLRQVDTGLSQLQDKLDKIRQDVEASTRRLATWYGRRKRLQSTEPVSLASEVAVTSPLVKDAKEAFEKATWKYLQASEGLRYDPSNQQKKDKVAELTQERKRYYRELLLAVKKAIDTEIAKADRKIAELTLERDAINEEIINLKQQREHSNIVMTGSPEEKEAKKAELTQQLNAFESELEAIKIQINAQDIYTFDDFEKDSEEPGQYPQEQNIQEDTLPLSP